LSIPHKSDYRRAASKGRGTGRPAARWPVASLISLKLDGHRHSGVTSRHPGCKSRVVQPARCNLGLGRGGLAGGVGGWPPGFTDPETPSTLKPIVFIFNVCKIQCNSRHSPKNLKNPKTSLRSDQLRHIVAPEPVDNPVSPSKTGQKHPLTLPQNPDNVNLASPGRARIAPKRRQMPGTTIPGIIALPGWQQVFCL
jgi:hypothetical protein